MHPRAHQIIVWTVLLISPLLPPPAEAQQTPRGVTDSSAPATVTLQPGPYYALVIGNNNYLHLNKLLTAVNDAKEVAVLLEGSYGFTVKPLYNATRDEILTSLVDYRRTLPANSNLLIYYAGHGHNDRDADEAYWLPIDAQPDNNQNWISADDITRDVRTIPSQHILIISDSCYSGVLTRGADVAINPSERGLFLAKMWNSKSRTLMASGADEPVADGGGGGHSIFANALLQGLKAMGDSEFTAAALFQRVQPSVAGRSAQLPQYSLIRNSGHNYGDFVFSKGGRPFEAPAVKIETLTDVGSEATDITTGADKSVVGQSPSSEQAIQRILDAYQQSYNYRDASILWKIWPSASARMRQTIDNSFRNAASIRMTLQMRAPEIDSNGQDAVVQGEFSQTFVTRDGSIEPPHTGPIVFILRKSNNIWVVSDIK